MNENAEAMRSIAQSFEKTYEMYVVLANHLQNNMYVALQKFLQQIFHDEPNSVEFLRETRKELAEMYEIADERAGKMSVKRLDLYAKAGKMYEESGEFETAGEMYEKSWDNYQDKAMELFDKVAEINSKNKL